MKKILLIIALLTSLNFAQSFPLLWMDDVTDNTGTVLLDSLKAYWALSDSTDSHGTNHLTNAGNTPFVAGKVGNCGDFELNDNTYMTIANNASLTLTGSVDFTIACWYNMESWSSAGIWTKSTGTADRIVLLFYDTTPTPDQKGFYVSNDGSATTGATATGTEGVNLATWYFVVCWRDTNTDSIYIQIDDGTIYQTAFNNTLPTDDNAFTLGRAFTPSTTNDFDGKIDEVAFWKRVLTPAERTYLYNSGNGRTYSGGKIE